VLAYVNKTPPSTTRRPCRCSGRGEDRPEPSLDLLAAYYGYKQNSFATRQRRLLRHPEQRLQRHEMAFSVVLDYRFSKRFDGYLGTFTPPPACRTGFAKRLPQQVHLTTTTGIRFKF